MEGINHAPYTITAKDPHGRHLGTVQVRSEWRKQAGKIELGTMLLAPYVGWSIKLLFKVGKDLGWTFGQQSRSHYVDPEWKARHTAPKVRAPYGSLKRGKSDQ